MNDDVDPRDMTKEGRDRIEASLADAPHGELEEFMRLCDDFCVACGRSMNVMPIEGCEDALHVVQFELAKRRRRPMMPDGFVPLAKDELPQIVVVGGHEVQNIQTRRQLVAFKRAHRMRDDWHEPDEQDVYAFPAIGHGFDNADCNPSGFEVVRAYHDDGEFVVSVLPNDSFVEHGVFLFHDGDPVAFVNLALLLAMACGFEGF